MSDPKRPCDLCGLAVGVKPFILVTPEKRFEFCCRGCKEIYEMLHQINNPPVGSAQNDAFES